MTRILHVEAFSSSNARENAGGLFDAFRRVGVAERFDYRGMAASVGNVSMNEQLIVAAIRFTPDLIFLGKCESVAGDTIAMIRRALPNCVVFHLFGDGRETPPLFVGDIGQYVDATLMQCADKAYFDKYLAAGCKRIETWIGGYNQHVIYPQPSKKKFDAVFMGNLSDGTGARAKQERINGRAGVLDGRREMIRLLIDAGVRVDVFGSASIVSGATYHRAVYGKEFSKACGSARFALDYDSNWRYLYHSWPRLIRTLGSGTLLLVRRFPGLDTLFENKKHLVWFDDLRELAPLARYYLAHENEAKAIGAAGCELVRSKYTYDHKVAQILELMK